MEHIPFVTDPGFLTLIWVFLAVGTVLATVGVFSLSVGDRKTTGKTVLLSVAAGAGFLMLSGVVLALTHSPSSPERLEPEWREHVAESFSEHYDTAVTVENVEDLEYPEAAPEGRVTYGTTTLKSGREVALVLNDGRAYLRIIGEELPFD